MIQVKPYLEYKSPCPYCATETIPAKDLRWIGIHICAQVDCPNCGASILDDMQVGHAVHTPFRIDLKKLDVLTNSSARPWLGDPLLEAITHPEARSIQITKEIFKKASHVIILNCIDYLYGHCLLKLLNSERHLLDDSQYGLILLIQPLLRWLVPDGVAEIWTADISLRQGQRYFLRLEEFIQKECDRFDEIYLSKAHSHPKHFHISKFSKTPLHDFNSDSAHVTFIWREDRVWHRHPLHMGMNQARRWIKCGTKEVRITKLHLWMQNWKIRFLFYLLSKRCPRITFSVAGLGTQTHFPRWICDERISQFDEETERKSCELYSRSRLVIGVHGSNMLLPSGHAGMTLDLMPRDRWGNLAQDILYQETDPRLAAYRYRFVAAQTGVWQLARVSLTMLCCYDEFRKLMMADSSTSLAPPHVQSN